MRKYDFNRIGLLLHVVDLSKDYPKLANITAAALGELEEMTNSKPEPVVVNEPGTTEEPKDEESKIERRV